MSLPQLSISATMRTTIIFDAQGLDGELQTRDAVFDRHHVVGPSQHVDHAFRDSGGHVQVEGRLVEAREIGGPGRLTRLDGTGKRYRVHVSVLSRSMGTCGRQLTEIRLGHFGHPHAPIKRQAGEFDESATLNVFVSTSKEEEIIVL